VCGQNVKTGSNGYSSTHTRMKRQTKLLRAIFFALLSMSLRFYWQLVGAKMLYLPPKSQAGLSEWYSLLSERADFDHFVLEMVFLLVACSL
jgi:hypothetical protein